jgi:two-component system, cell cycle sensor histidine kinase and response regulator CckA
MDLQPLVEETLKLLRSVLPSTIQMVRHIHPAPPVLVDPTQIHQVIMNLCVNAQHAMEGRQGRLEVGLDEVLADESLCARSADLCSGRYARITIRDTGCGMSPEILNRIFEPFFTTKEVGQGTGLGLAVVHGIVKNYNGAILVQSRPGEGSVFEVFLPAQIKTAEPAAESSRPVFRANGEHIMLLDDEVGIAKALNLLLTRTGYQVTAFTDSQVALREFLRRPMETDLILTDLTMPGMTGLELARRVYGIRPELPVVVTTGFGGDLVSPGQLEDQPNIRKVVQKPVNADAILRILEEILKQGRRI